MNKPYYFQPKIPTKVENIEYVPNAVLSRTVLKKTTGTVTVSALDEGEEITEIVSPFDNFIQIIDGTAEIFMDGETRILVKGNGIIVPANQMNTIKATERFKMISTVIKNI